MKLVKLLFLLFFVLILSGCDVTYNLDISSNGYVESVDVIYYNGESSSEYAIPVVFGTMDYEDPETNFFEKVKGVKYYNSNLLKNDDGQVVNYNYSFNESSIKKSNFINSAYNTFILKKYDHDEDGKKDYMLLATDDEIDLFERFDMINSIKINITCYYEVISSNAEQVNENVYTWYLTKDDLKSINMVYNPDKVVDYRSFFEKIFDGSYSGFLLAFLFGIIFAIVGIIYILLKKRSEKVDKI